ncbi:oligopeptidase b [Stylonychia lemnae]|uniref:Oligopeptidase b n=1 Tax=Stylonychia lemnae TaxID=5949 RepID=A0A078A4I3_STYLE|nr:oligopeptidase b [Stylonychia lemnae]|eukprot:CDW77077.1 oligopeptidase b [Stylonychia lemnae]
MYKLIAKTTLSKAKHTAPISVFKFNSKLCYLNQQRSIFNFLRKKTQAEEQIHENSNKITVEDNTEKLEIKELRFIKQNELAKQNQEDQLAQQATNLEPLKEDDTKILRDLYIPKEEEGLDRFDNSLSKLPEYESQIAQSKDINELNTLIGQTNKKLVMKYKREHAYKLEKYEERLYKEVFYDLRPNKNPQEEVTIMNPLKKSRLPHRYRNIVEISQESYREAQWPRHQRRPQEVVNIHTMNKEGRIMDPYKWMEHMSEEEKKDFLLVEHDFYTMCMMKQDLLTRQIQREQDHYQHIAKPLPVRIGEFLYYRRFENPADSMTIYRFPIDAHKIRGHVEGELPYMWINHDNFEQVEKSETAKEFPEQILFEVQDLTLLYKEFALRDENIKTFIENITEMLQTQSHQPLYHFQISDEQDLALMAFDTEMNQKSLDLVIKDLKINRLLPVLIKNTDGQYAFDKSNGIYYTQVDAFGRGVKVYRHQVGTLNSFDKLVYEETNPDFFVNVENTLSGDFIMINIQSNFSPKTNEIWIKNAHQRQERFWLVQTMQQNVDYQIKHSGEFLYKMSNEDDKNSYKITKIMLPDQIKSLPKEGEYQRLEQQSKTQEQNLQPNHTSDIQRLGKREIQPIMNDMQSRQQQLLQTLPTSSIIDLPVQRVLVEAKEDENIIDFEVYKHYLTVIQEKNQQRIMKIINLKTEREYTHLFDSEKELNPADGLITDFYDVEMEDNYTFDSASLRYRLYTPNTPQRVLNINLGTKKTEQIFMEQYQNFSKPENIQCEKIQVRMRDGQEIPMVMTYDKQFFNEKSPWIMFTKGAKSEKSDLQYKIL